jgi:hypothetical protein
MAMNNIDIYAGVVFRRAIIIASLPHFCSFNRSLNHHRPVVRSPAKPSQAGGASASMLAQ